MENETKKTISMITVVAGAIMVYMVALILIAWVKNYNKGIVVEDIVSKWECTVDGEKLDEKVSLNNKFINLKVGSKVIFTKKSKELEGEVYPAFICDFMFCSAKVFYDDNLVYTHRYNKGISSKTEATVQLEDYKKGKEIRIELNIANPSRKIYMEEAKLIEETEVTGYRLRHNMYSLILAGLLLMFGVIATIITACIKSKSMDVKQLFWISLLSITLAIFLLAKKNLFYYMFREQVVTEVALTIAIVIAIPSIMRIHLYMYRDDKLKKIFQVFFAILVILVGGFLIFEDSLEKYVNTIVLIGIVFLILMIGLIILLYKDIKSTEGIKKFFDVGMFIIYGTIVGMLVTLLFFDYIYFIKVFETGIMFISAIILLFVMIYYSYKIKEYMEKIAEDKVLETLAFIDPLTGLMNRTRYEEELKSIREENYIICSVISFDLNYLKEMNDLNGHEAGDEYIKSFSMALRIGFGEDGFVARIGGDEFIAIIKNKYVDIESSIEEMQRMLKNTMKKYKDAEISFAYGTAISRKGQNKTINELIEVSDKKMYENKRKLKEERQTN